MQKALICLELILKIPYKRHYPVFSMSISIGLLRLITMQMHLYLHAYFSLNPLAKEFSLERKLPLTDLNPYAPVYIPLNSRRFGNSQIAIIATVLIISALFIHEINNNENLELNDMSPRDTLVGTNYIFKRGGTIFFSYMLFG